MSAFPWARRFHTKRHVELIEELLDGRDIGEALIKGMPHSCEPVH
jgi:hypothetical protein